MLGVETDFPSSGKTKFRKRTEDYGMSTLGAKTKVVRSEILYILVGLTACGDPYLIVSWTFEIWAQGPGPGKFLVTF